MTKQELITYIESFEKNPGCYTEEELYKIGVAHKSLDNKSDKNWDELANIVGMPKDGENYRCWVNRRQRADGSLPKNLRELNSRTITEASEEELNNNFDEQIRALYKQQVKTRDTMNAYRRTLRDEARLETITECIADSIKELNTLPKAEYNGLVLHNNAEAVLMLSDLHIGVDCNNFYNTYNTEIARKRVSKLVDATIEYCKLHKVSTLHVLNMGDMIHGTIHISARLEQETDVISQVMIASEILADALNKLQEAAPMIIYRSVLDNHSRVVANKNEHIEKENLNRIIDWYLKERLKSTSVVFMNDNLDAGLGKFSIKSKTIMFAHGHQDSANTSFQHFVGATGELVDYVLLAHYHNSQVKSYQGLNVIVNGSICGTEEYAFSKRLFSKPAQTLLVFDKFNNLHNINIVLD